MPRFATKLHFLDATFSGPFGVDSPQWWGHVITYATVFPGTDILDEALECISRTWEMLYGVRVVFKKVFMCENNPAAMRWLMAQFPECLLIKDAAQLCDGTVKNGVTGKLERIQNAFMLVAGFLCCDKSNM